MKTYTLPSWNNGQGGPGGPGGPDWQQLFSCSFCSSVIPNAGEMRHISKNWQNANNHGKKHAIMFLTFDFDFTLNTSQGNVAHEKIWCSMACENGKNIKYIWWNLLTIWSHRPDPLVMIYFAILYSLCDENLTPKSEKYGICIHCHNLTQKQ